MTKLLILALFLLPHPTLAQSWKSDFESYVEQLMESEKIPGIAIQVVGADGTVLQITKGYRDLGRRLPVTPSTLFAIGSTTKAFTGVLLAQVRDMGLIDFDAPVQTYLPGFAIADEDASRYLNLRDLMGHWTGVGRHDLAWYHRQATREELLSLIPHLDLSAKPREKFIYNNLMWLAAGAAAESVTGKSWEQLLRENLLDPLGMGQTTADLNEVVISADHALPYAGNQEIPFLNIAPLNPAGGIYSNLNDLAHWLQMHLHRGLFQGKRIVSEGSLAETYRPYSRDQGSPYAMGWFVTDALGETLYTHDGGIDGFTANVSWMPGRRLGVAVLMNTITDSATPESIAFRLWQHLLGQEPVDWAARRKENAKKRAEEQKKLYPDPAPLQPKRPLAEFAGNFCHRVYGKSGISLQEDGSLRVKLSVVDVPLIPHGELSFFIPHFFDRKKFLDFGTDAQGSVTTLQWKLEDSSDAPIVFHRCG
jgi:CubicO group peptidase (beta-lactamase class C family)